MDYDAFFADVRAWISQVNDAAARHGMQNPAFWQWIADSAGAICRKYNEHRLAIKQMMMLVEWLEEVHDQQRVRDHT